MDVTFVEEHGGHLTHLNPLHNVKMIDVTSGSLCENINMKSFNEMGSNLVHKSSANIFM